MTEDKNKKTITIRQGVGNDAIEISVQVTQEELDKMEQIRRFSPENWEGKDMELLQEARKVIREKQSQEPEKQSHEQETMQVPAKNDDPAKSNNKGLWWALGVFGLLFVAFLIFNSVVKQKTDEMMAPYILNNRVETLQYKGLTLNHPGNWNFTTYELSDGVYMVGGRDQSDSEFGVFWMENTDASVESAIDDIVIGYANSNKFSNVEYSAIYTTTFNDIPAKAVDYSYTHEGRAYHAEIIGFVTVGKTVIINPIAHSTSTLSSDDFNMMKSSLKFHHHK